MFGARHLAGFRIAQNGHGRLVIPCLDLVLCAGWTIYGVGPWEGTDWSLVLQADCDLTSPYLNLLHSPTQSALRVKLGYIRYFFCERAN